MRQDEIDIFYFVSFTHGFVLLGFGLMENCHPIKYSHKMFFFVKVITQYAKGAPATTLTLRMLKRQLDFLFK